MILTLLLIAPGAFAQDAAQLAHYTEGNYELAASASGESQTADSLAFQARAVLAGGICSDIAPTDALLTRAENFAREALFLDPDHQEAKLQLAIALSLKARPLSNREALKFGYGEEAEHLAKKVLAQDPDNAYANGFMAVWHLEVVRRGGPIGSRLMGASVKKARKHYRNAAEISPGDAGIHWQYARALAALNPQKYRRDIDAALAAAQNAPVDNHVEAVMATRAGKLQEMLHSNNHNVIKAWAALTL